MQMLAISSVHRTLLLTALLCTALSAASSRASVPTNLVTEKMDVGTHGFLIEKLETVLAATPKGDSTRVPARLRLADLYSERARLIFMQEIEQGCQGDAKKTTEQTVTCGQSAGDRKKAIEHYEAALKESSGKMQSRILFQLAYLYEANGRDSQAASLYKRILQIGSPTFSKIVLGQSEAGLGEVAFRAKRFSAARKHYENALKNSETPRRGWIHYRIAWCELNLNQAEKGKARLLTVLKTPELLRIESTDGIKADESFQEDIAHDLTIFYGRTGFSQADIENLWSLSPVDARKEILIELANEAERLGQKRASIAVWATLAQKANEDKGGLKNLERLEAQIRVAYLQYALGEKQAAAAGVETAVAIWKKSGCAPEAECELLKKRLRKLVIDWNKNETTEPSLTLLAAYTSYVSQFPEDAEMAFWGANVARELKQARQAAKLYRIASSSARAILSAKGPAANDPNIPTVFEGSLVAEVEMAEQTGDAALKTEAYNHYLAFNPKGPKVLEIRYQLADLAYKAGDHKAASVAFFAIATGQVEGAESCRDGLPNGVCKQAADLALDSTVILRDEVRLEAWAIALSEQSPKHRDEFLGIARKARLNMAAKAATSESKSQSAMRENLDKLKALDLRKASREEALLTYRNRFVLAEKLGDFAEANAAAIAVLKYPGLTGSEREDALAKQLWIAEMQLDFGTAYATAKKMKMPKLTAVDRELKLALFAELAGQNPRPHLETYIRTTKDKRGKLVARAKLVKLSGYDLKEFARQFNELKAQRAIFAAVALEVYSRHPSKQLAAKILGVRGMRQTAEGGHIARAKELKAMQAWLASTGRSVLPRGASDRVLAHAIKSRMAELARADRFANQMIAAKDGWLQAVALTRVMNENRRLKEEILALPLPKGLKAKDQARYQQLINKQVRPFEQKAQSIERKVAKFWASSAAENLAREVETSHGPRRQFLVLQARVLASGSPEAISRRLQQAIETEQQESRVAQVESARRDVRQNPFDFESLRKLRELEAEAGRETMVAYLDTRMKQQGARR